MERIKTAAALSLCLAAATCSTAQQQLGITGAAIVAPIECSAVYSADANKAALCKSITGLSITVAQAILNGETQ